MPTSGAGGGNGGSGLVSPVPLDPALMSRCTGSKPIKCTILVPANGNYNVTVELGSAQAASSSQIEAELARIVVPTVKLVAGAYAQHTFSVNVRDETHDDYTFLASSWTFRSMATPRRSADSVTSPPTSRRCSWQGIPRCAIRIPCGPSADGHRSSPST
jgi:hypothetical protein